MIVSCCTLLTSNLETYPLLVVPNHRGNSGLSCKMSRDPKVIMQLANRLVSKKRHLYCQALRWSLTLHGWISICTIDTEEKNQFTYIRNRFRIRKKQIICLNHLSLFITSFSITQNELMWIHLWPSEQWPWCNPRLLWVAWQWGEKPLKLKISSSKNFLRNSTPCTPGQNPRVACWVLQGKCGCRYRWFCWVLQIKNGRHKKNTTKRKQREQSPIAATIAAAHRHMVVLGGAFGFLDILWSQFWAPSSTCPPRCVCACCVAAPMARPGAGPMPRSKDSNNNGP